MINRGSARDWRPLLALLLGALALAALTALAAVATAEGSGGNDAPAAEPAWAGAGSVGSARRRGCRGLKGTKLRRCRAIAKCKRLKSRKKRKRCLARARKIGKRHRRVAAPTPPLTNLQVLQARPRPPSCAAYTSFSPSNFPSTPKINNVMFPLAPGTKLILEGRANRGGGPTPHRVTFTVTDLTKVVDGVRSVVVWDVDTNEGEVVESELSFFAQDKAGNVWNVGEYPEEYEAGNFAGAPNTWISGQKDAQPGIHMLATPVVTDPAANWYIQGSSPAIDFLDCARVASLNQSTCVPFKCYDNVLVTNETSPLDPESGIQTKFHAPHVGIVQVGALNDPEGETLVLVNRYTLSASGLDRARREALKLDQRGYDVSESYRATGPAK
jgi:hypothetical protein